jgi:hypothetical protein
VLNAAVDNLFEATNKELTSGQQGRSRARGSKVGASVGTIVDTPVGALVGL